MTRLTHSTPLARLSEQPGPGINDRLVLVDGYEALDDADQRPNEPPCKNREADEYHAQRNADREVQQSDPEGPDLELVMRPQHRVSIVDLHVRDDDASQRRNPGEITHAVKHVDNDSESIVRDEGPVGFGSKGHGRLRCDGDRRALRTPVGRSCHIPGSTKWRARADEDGHYSFAVARVLSPSRLRSRAPRIGRGNKTINQR